MLKKINPMNDSSITFKASNGWIHRFLNRFFAFDKFCCQKNQILLFKFRFRFNLVTRRISSSGRDLPKDCANTVYEYLKTLNQKLKSYSANEVISFDETSIYADMLENYTYDRKLVF
jgi:hypothetical protein